MRKTLTLLLCGGLGTLTACAGSTAGSATSRAFERAELASVPLQSLSVWVAAKPAVEDEGSLDDVDAFGPPRLDQPLSPVRVDPVTQRALLTELEGWARDRGFALTAASASSARPTLREVLAGAATDAVLVVRVVPVDRFTVFQQAGEQQMIDTGDPATQVLTTAESGEDRVGRLLVGQAFLFEPTSRIRLWSRQIPQFPAAGRLTPDDPFLRYGFVAEDVDEALDPAVKARRAAAAFVPSILEDFPAPTPGDRAALAELNTDRFQRAALRQRFLDDNHTTLEVGVGWELPSIRSSARALQDVGELEPVAVPLPDLGPGALAPAGSFELAAKLTWIQPGGLSFGFGLETGFIPGDYQRTAFVENRDEVGNFDQAVEVTAAGGITVGGSLTVGYLIPLSSSLFLHPEAGMFVDLYAFDTSPTVPDASHLTVGGQADLSVWWRPSPDRPLFMRAGAGGRLGPDLSGDVLGSARLLLSVGWFL